MKRFFYLFLVLPTLLWAGGTQEKKGEEDSMPQVFTSNYPLYFAAEELSGGGAELLWLFPEDEDPAFWEPSRKDLERLQKADLLLFNGAGYEKWREYAFLEEGRIRDAGASLTDDFIDTGMGEIHSHGGGEEHSHGGIAFTLWMDLNQYGRQASEVAAALKNLLPSDSAEIDRRLEEFLSKLEELDREFLNSGKAFEDESLLASHPVYQYFARAYLGEVDAMLWEPDVFPSTGEWAALEDLKERTGARFMIWEDEPLSETRSRLEEMDLEPVIIRPGFAMPGTGDFFDILRPNLEELRRPEGLL